MRKKRFNKAFVREDGRKAGLVFMTAGTLAIFTTPFDDFLWAAGICVIGFVIWHRSVLEEVDSDD